MGKQCHSLVVWGTLGPRWDLVFLPLVPTRPLPTVILLLEVYNYFLKNS